MNKYSRSWRDYQVSRFDAILEKLAPFILLALLLLGGMIDGETLAR